MFWSSNQMMEIKDMIDEQMRDGNACLQLVPVAPAAPPPGGPAPPPAHLQLGYVSGQPQPPGDAPPFRRYLQQKFLSETVNWLLP